MEYKNYMGNSNIGYIYNGDWADPIIEYKGFQWSEWAIVDALYDDYKDDLKHGYATPDFDDYLRDRIEDYLNDCLYGLCQLHVEYIRDHAPIHFESLRDALYWNDDEWPEDREPRDDEVVEHYQGVSFVVEDFWAA